MTDVAGLIAGLHDKGVEMTPNGDKLRVVAPRGVLTPDLRELLRHHKSDILQALRAPCCSACGRRAGPPLDISDGCVMHGVSAEDVARWWALAQERDAEVSWCHCCAGPAPLGALRCRRCEEKAGQR